MAKCTQSAQEFIYNVFPAMVGCLASEDAEAICQKNDLSFVELIRPFCQLDAEAHIRDPVNPNIVIPVKNWKIRVINIQSSRPPKALVNRILNEVVNKSVSQIDLASSLSIEEQFGARTPWFEAYRDCFFQLIQPMQHEFLRDYLSCILVVSTKHPDPMHAFAALSSRQNSIQSSPDKQKASYHWFDASTFKYYVLLHDVSEGDDSKAEKVFLSMKSVYGSHTCFLLQINSRKKMFPHTVAGEKMSFSDPWTDYMYPFNDETLNVDENEIANENKHLSAPSTTLRDIERKEQAIVNELESIEKEIAERPEAPQRSLSFNDPLTSMHYDTLDEDDAIEPIKARDADKPHQPVTQKLSERSQKLDDYKRSLRQFSYKMVTSMTAVPQNTKKERGQCMALVDLDKIKAFVYEFVVRGLLPHIEKLMRNLSEQTMNRRGLHKSLFNVTKKWFGGGKNQSNAVGTNVTSANYQRDSPELQYRRLGDLAFLVQHYDLAYNSYHSAKREFNNDHAWLYFAGSLEMAAISAFLTPNNKNYPVHYFEACISTYLNTCRLPEYATRACLLSTETFKSKNRYLDAAVEFIKLTNEESDLGSALLLEQAAQCYLNNPSAMIRKYAFHMILAGHRYSKSAQRKHTLRCYVNALQIYQQKGWHLAEDHVNFVIGRQSFNLGNLMDAHVALKCLLLYESQQNPSQQASHLREFLAVYKQHLDSTKNTTKKKNTLPHLPLPYINSQSIKCLTYYKGQLTSQTPLSNTPSISKRTRTIHAGAYTFQRNQSKTYTQKWAEMEKEIVKSVTGDLPYPFKPYTPCLSSYTQNRTAAIVACSEQVAYEVVFLNPLKIPLNMLHLTLLWEFKADSTSADEEEPQLIDNMEQDQSDCVDCEVLGNFQLKPAEEKPACLRLSVKRPGFLRIRGVKYTLSSIGIITSLDEQSKVEINAEQENALQTVGVYGMQEINVKGARLNNTKQEKSMMTYDVDKRLELQIIPELPLLEVTINNLPVTLLHGEVQTCQFAFKNIGQTSLKNLYLICSFPNSFAFNTNPCTPHHTSATTANAPTSLINLSNLLKDSNGITRVPLTDGKLTPGDEVILSAGVYGALTPGVHEIHFLFYYEPCESVKKIPYRLLQQMIRIQTVSTLNVTSMIQKSHCNNGNREVGVDQVPNQTHIMSLNVENRAQNAMNLRCAEFTLKGITCYSKSWSVSSLVRLPQEAFLLRPGETCSFHLKTKRCPENQDKDQVVVSNIPFDDQDTSVSVSSLMLFLQAKGNVSAIENSFALILQWETFFIDENFTRNVIRGQTHITCTEEISRWIAKPQLPNVVETENPSSYIPSPSSGIKLDYRYNAINTHDFKSSSLCRVPITVQCNNLTTSEAQIEFEALDFNEQTSGVGIQLEENSLHQILWSGHRKQTVLVPPSSSSSITLDLLTSVGLFEIQNLSAWLIKTIDNGAEERLRLMLPSSHYVCVKST